MALEYPNGDPLLIGSEGTPPITQYDFENLTQEQADALAGLLDCGPLNREALINFLQYLQNGLQGDPVGFKAHKNGVRQTLAAASVSELITFTHTEFNIGDHFDTSASKFVVPIDGIYLFAAILNRTPTGSNFGHVVGSLRVDGSLTEILTDHFNDNASISVSGSIVKYLTAGQEVQLFGSIGHASDKRIDGGSHETSFSGALISKVAA